MHGCVHCRRFDRGEHHSRVHATNSGLDRTPISATVDVNSATTTVQIGPDVRGFSDFTAVSGIDSGLTLKPKTKKPLKPSDSEGFNW